MIDKAILRDGSILKVGDEVTQSKYDKYADEVFVIEEINEYPCCESGCMVLAHLKGDPEKKLKGFDKPGYVKLSPAGIDANWFKKINSNT